MYIYIERERDIHICTYIYIHIIKHIMVCDYYYLSCNIITSTIISTITIAIVIVIRVVIEGNRFSRGSVRASSHVA